MGIYVDEGTADDMLYAEVLRQEAVDRARPIACRGDPRLEQVVRAAARSYGTAASAISIIDRDQQVFVAREGLDLWSTARDASFCAVAIQRPGEPLVVPDARLDRRFCGKPAVIAPPHVRFYAGITIVDRSGYALGALCVFDDRPRFSETDVTTLSFLAREVERIVCR